MDSEGIRIPADTPGDQARQLDTSRDTWKLMETTEDQQTPLKTKGEPVRPGSNNGDQAETHGDQVRPSERPLDTRQDNWTPAETPETKGNH